ncbi:hypothetical protein [Acinetobacter genomosp. 15BJ]|uniref:Uncharacterized protein n=1 Tax=Acinetobacter genomosp. 15BJ TaxID=106651 RepID=R9ATX6_9GAMM|nr:hypothetical protein [Acinetobacter genomosp. 15BJ]EOR05689.1 hypothetical protein F896_03115 [Acinetobacter genomosp. 15BJ]MCH7290839.1 hypothetical protein [Acinetobacter genomosp. 15BJ]MDO3659044.1 hypothetical protein [Acinetobacter genomosp. 15BJ]
MTFERTRITNEKLEQLVIQVEPLIQDLDLDFPIRIDESLLVDEERNIYYLSFFGGGGGASQEKKIILEKEGPYYFDGYENNPVTHYHWPTVEAIITTKFIIYLTHFGFTLAENSKKKADNEFYISSLSIQYSHTSDIIRINDESEIQEEVRQLIAEALVTYEETRKIKDWAITTQVYYNLKIDMLKGLRKNND